MATPKLILFDIDCTLLWTRGAGREAMKLAMLDLFGRNDGIDQHDFGGKTDWQSLVELLSPHGHTIESIGQIIADYDRAMGKHLDRVIGHFAAAPCPGARELVAELHAHPDTLLGVVTGNCRSTAPIKLRAAGFDPAYFPVGAYGSEAYERDHLPPLALERALTHYQLPLSPDQIVVVGDTPADVQCGKALGAVTVAVRTGFCSLDMLEASQPDYLIDDLSQFNNAVLA